MEEAQDVQKQGAYHAVHLRCTPGHEEQFWPLFHAFCAAQEAGDAAEEARIKPLLREHQSVVSEETFPNVVVNLGRNYALDTLLRSSAFTSANYLGLCGTGTKAAADTQASHAGWSEVGGANAPVYTGNRKTVTFNAAASQAISHAAVNFAFTSGGTVAGCFLNLGGSATKDSTTATLFSAGNFTGGDKVVANGDALDVTYTLNG